MKILLLPGNESPDDSKWLSKIEPQLGKIDFHVDTITYDHWGKRDQGIDIDNEVQKINDYTAKNDDYFIVAKCMGIILALIANQQKNINPKASVFLGSPIKTGQGIEFLKLFDPPKFPVLFIQQESDKLTPYQYLIEVLANSKKDNFKSISISGGDHVYDDFDQVIPIISNYVNN